MTYIGHVKNGVVVLDGEASLPEGAEVDITPRLAAAGKAEEEIPTLYEQFKDVIGIAEGLPSDFAANHDHYIHGTPKWH